MKLIIGLGNPEKKYKKTRHNIGWRAADIIIGKNAWKENKKFDALLSEIKINNTKIIVAKPLTYMNNSGITVQKISKYYKIKKQDILVICDDIDLLIGTLRLRESGSSGGHRGLQSVLSFLKTKNIARLKIGVAEKKSGKQSIASEKYILKQPSYEAEKIIKKSLKKIPEIIKYWIKGEKNASFNAL